MLKGDSRYIILAVLIINVIIIIVRLMFIERLIYIRHCDKHSNSFDTYDGPMKYTQILSPISKVETEVYGGKAVCPSS